MKLRAEIIAIGTEILLGDIINSNASYIARGLAGLGIDTFHQQVVGDNPRRVKQAMEEAYENANLVITSGGLGPTEDDLSKEMGAEYFGVPMVMDEIAREHIRNYMTLRGRTIPDNNWKQAMLPEGCRPLYNHNGTAPGFILEKDGKILVIPYLRSLSEDVMISRTLHLCGMGESAVESVLHDEMITMTNPTLAPYAKEGVVDLRITAKGESEEACREMIAPVEAHIRELFGDLVFGADSDTLPQVLLRELSQRGLKLAVAEACAGGLISSKLVSVSGASAAYLGGLVAYSDESKIRLLGVRKETLSDFGAVSEATACEMAIGAAKAFGADAAIAETGIAEPASDTSKPSGTVCVAVYLKGEVSAVTMRYSRNRNSNREMASTAALNELRKALIKHDR